MCQFARAGVPLYFSLFITAGIETEFVSYDTHAVRTFKVNYSLMTVTAIV